MALCTPMLGCSCALQSSSISIAGDGSGSNPYILTALGTHVCTSGTRPTGIQGLEIYETDTARSLIYDGTNWVIQSGQMPGCSAYSTAVTQSIPNNSTTTVNITTEVYDIGGFHTSTNGFYTIPSGMAGDYIAVGGVRYTTNATGSRAAVLTVGSNGSIVNHPVIRANTYPSEASTGPAAVVSISLRLVAGATVTLQTIQNSGGSLNLIDGYMTLDMIRHIPSLT